MKNLLIVFTAISIVTLGLFACGNGNPSSFTVSGTIENAGNMQVFLEKTGIVANTPNTVIAKSEANSAGAFLITVPEGLTPGLYRVRIGEQKINLVFDGTERQVKVGGALQNLNQYQYTLEGSENSLSFLKTVQQYMRQQPTVNDIENLVDSSTQPLVAAYVAVMAFGNNPTYTAIHQRALQKLETAYPGSSYASDYKVYINSLTQVAQNPPQGGNSYTYIEEAERKPAIDIRLPSPNGKEYALSSLKGNVVLLDFWASWCMPCRRENPHVVEVYRKYKDKGFTVFSVSLDGVDSRTASRFSGDAGKVAEMVANGKQAWTGAIAKDGLEWPYHVSDLKKWDCEPARQYGVSGIPKAFILDREGRIAAVNVRGAQQIEEAILKLL